MTVCFICGSEYQVFVASILAATEYKESKKIITLPKIERYIKISERLSKSKMWDRVYLIGDNGSRDDILEQLEGIDYKSISVLHYFSFGNRPSNLLFGLVKNYADIILTEEGFLTYDIVNGYENYKENETVEWFDEGLDFKMFKSIWTFNKHLVNNRYNHPIKEIDFLKNFDKLENKQNLLEMINDIFDYRHSDIDADVIFFDQYYSLIEMVDIEVEKYILGQLSECVTGGKLCVKPHPSEMYFDKYNKDEVDLLSVDRIPWEVMLLNLLFHKKEKKKLFLISYSSTSLLNSILVNNPNFEVHIAFICKIINRYLTKKTSDKTLLNFAESYGPNVVSIPENFTELRQVIEKKLNGDSKIDYDALYDEERETELNWLRKNRIQWSKVSSIKPLHLSTLNVWLVGIPNKLSENMHIVASDGYYQVYYDISKYTEVSRLRFSLAQLPVASCKIKSIDTDGLLDNVTAIGYESCFEDTYFFVGKQVAFDIDGNFDNATYIRVDFEFDYSENVLNQAYFSLKEKLQKLETTLEKQKN